MNERADKGTIERASSDLSSCMWCHGIASSVTAFWRLTFNKKQPLHHHARSLRITVGLFISRELKDAAIYRTLRSLNC